MSETSSTGEETAQRRSKLRRGLFRGMKVLGAGVLVLVIGALIDQIGDYGNTWGELLILLGSWVLAVGVLILAFYAIVWLVKVGVNTARED